MRVGILRAREWFSLFGTRVNMDKLMRQTQKDRLDLYCLWPWTASWRVCIYLFRSNLSKAFLHALGRPVWIALCTTALCRETGWVDKSVSYWNCLGEKQWWSKLGKWEWRGSERDRVVREEKPSVLPIKSLIFYLIRKPVKLYAKFIYSTVNVSPQSFPQIFYWNQFIPNPSFTNNRDPCHSN